MHSSLPKYADSDSAAQRLRCLGDSFAIVKNPPYVFPPYDIYALAPPKDVFKDGFVAAVMDMDGTTTTTEALCIAALEAMVRRMSGLETDAEGAVLDHNRDYPHIIGNSTTKHVEYLVQTYKNSFQHKAIMKSFIRSIAWTRIIGKDPGRARDAENTLYALGGSNLLTDASFIALGGALAARDARAETLVEALINRFPALVSDASSIPDLVRIGIEIYYQHYHETLQSIASGRKAQDPVNPLIEPMPGIGVALALLKGWLGEDASLLQDLLADHLHALGIGTEQDINKGRTRLARLGEYFRDHPVKLALVTSSIAYEANIVLGEVFRVITEQINHWPLSQERRSFLRDQFCDPDRVYDARITASDSSEIRLKPHRDLYALALHALGIAPEAFHRVAGFEDSESGVIAIRAAGISLCCALPFAMTQGHQFDAATHVCRGGMPEIILLKNFFLPMK